ncbi:hypothetical protein VOLCADRAFT_120843 [Volvox carteri f. nagariensis]|uniref:Uncharacterized protein n=1 Tax=Volvox carteri f. nagariensis TaxID=3068 RepID=D8TUU5_VOLCA|nr:uncharacterized protein VOLCADRAFT_120843 [Volvox carteri f. nagariensis]EFJ48883.1 hypothetical protein VOLCADRAFT_120843 [Volvox carteri f. nagariensis]|eukprot:XP_002950215.1 hypothetical protein VOLCADRAFT_120843 [Volvox carteri f. nagariensis]
MVINNYNLRGCSTKGCTCAQQLALRLRKAIYNNYSLSGMSMALVSNVGVIISTVIFLLGFTSTRAHHIEINITVPTFEVETEDAYVCVSALLPPHPHKLIGVIPHAQQEVVHHILLYGCSEPHLVPKTAGQMEAWRCDMKPVCNGPSTIFYGWGRNAPDLRLPEGVGYSVGENTGIKYIVAQVHYLAVRPPDDHSGVTLVLKPHAVPYAAGMLSYASYFQIPPGQPSHLVENSCCFKAHQPLTMFAVRVHTHVLGRQVYLTREAWNHSGTELLYTRDPQLPQSFVPSTRHVFWPGDRLTVTCDFDSTNRSTVTVAGSTHKDEMCNMYIMVYGKTPYLSMCSDSTAPDGTVLALPGEAAAGAGAGAGAGAADGRETNGGGEGKTGQGRRRRRQQEGGEDEEGDYFFGGGGGDDGGGGGSSGGGGGTGTGIQLVVDPRGRFGDATSVTTGPDGSIWVLYRASGVWQGDTFDSANRITRSRPVPEAVVVRLDPDNGTVLARWGAATFYLPHMISTDADGNVWVVDVGRHQVLKFTPEGQLLLAMGTELTPGSGPNQFCKPTQVAVLRDGSFLVADGYCNDRVVWFDAEGRYKAESVAIPPVVHSVLVDECEGLVYVASREAGQAWALGFGPYGEQLVLMWSEGQDARLVNVRFPQQFWNLPGTARLSPHDFQLGGAPMQLAGAGDRMYAVYLASVGAACDQNCGPLRKFVVVPPGVALPEAKDLPTISHVTDIHPGDAELLPGGTAVSEQPHHLELPPQEREVGVSNAADGGAEGVVEAGGGAEGGGAMVADDYDEELEEDVVAAEDYQEEEEEKEEAQLKATEGQPHHQQVPAAPLEKERFEVLVQDKKVVERSTSISGWGLVLLAILVVLLAYSVLRFSKISLSAYLQEDSQAAGAPATAPPAGGGAGGGLLAAGGWRKTAGVWAAAAEGLWSRIGAARGGIGGPRAAKSGGGGAAGREVEAARDRERLLKSEP